MQQRKGTQRIHSRWGWSGAYDRRYYNLTTLVENQSIPFKCLPEQWREPNPEDNGLGRFLRSFKFFKELNPVLEKKLLEANKILREYELNDIPFSFEQFERDIKKQQASSLLKDYYNQLITTLENQKRIGSASIYLETLNLLKVFAPKALITDINIKFLESFEEWLRNERKSNKKEPQQVAEIFLRYKPTIQLSQALKITNSKEVYQFFIQTWDMELIEFIEEFKVLLLNRANKILGFYQVSVGGVAGTVVDPKLVFAAALKANASGIALCHNHPSGNLQQSEQDRSLTQKLKKAGEFLDLVVIDHLIITAEGYYSFADKGLL